MKAMPDVYDVAEDGTISAVEMDGERVIVPPAITDEVRASVAVLVQLGLVFRCRCMLQIMMIDQV